jgi:hypothetical protein
LRNLKAPQQIQSSLTQSASRYLNRSILPEAVLSSSSTKSMMCGVIDLRKLSLRDMKDGLWPE